MLIQELGTDGEASIFSSKCSWTAILEPTEYRKAYICPVPGICSGEKQLKNTDFVRETLNNLFIQQDLEEISLPLNMIFGD